jgi:hypothetical protein
MMMCRRLLLYRNVFTWLPLLIIAVDLQVSPSWRVGAFSSLVSKEGGKVRVHVEESLDVPCEQAQRAWLDYQWQRGGGLLGVYVWTSSSDEMNRNTRRRVLAPIWMQEQILQVVSPSPSNEENTIRYQVTDMGLFSFDLDSSSHSATVQFVSNNPNTTSHANSNSNMTTMIWDVEFQAQHCRELWQAMAQFQLQTAASNLKAYVATPSYYQRTTFLVLKSNGDHHHQNHLSIQQVMEEWKSFIWYQGGGLPLPPPIRCPPWNNDDQEDRMIVPPFLIERLQSMEMMEEMEQQQPSASSILGGDENNHPATGVIRYTVVNPGIFTYPVHTHAGKISFTTSASTSTTPTREEEEDRVVVKMVWEVQVRPFAGCTPLVQGFTSAVVSTLARNFKVHIQEGPNATVAVAPPRGGKGGGDNAFYQVPKRTWLGGVLQAHLLDRRSTMEQTISLFQPWTWGRTSTDESGEGEEWSRGDYLSDE